MEVQEIDISTIHPDIDDLILIQIDCDKIDLDEASDIANLVASTYPNNNMMLLPKDHVQIKILKDDSDIDNLIGYLEDIKYEQFIST